MFSFLFLCYHVLQQRLFQDPHFWNGVAVPSPYCRPVCGLRFCFLSQKSSFPAHDLAGIPLVRESPDMPIEGKRGHPLPALLREVGEAAVLVQETVDLWGFFQKGLVNRQDTCYNTYL